MNTLQSFQVSDYVEHDDDSWKSPIRMLYRVTITVRTTAEQGAAETFVLMVANFHNAEAIQEAFQGVPTIGVTIEPDVLAYIRKVHPYLDTDVSELT